LRREGGGAFVGCEMGERRGERRRWKAATGRGGQGRKMERTVVGGVGERSREWLVAVEVGRIRVVVEFCRGGEKLA